MSWNPPSDFFAPSQQQSSPAQAQETNSQMRTRSQRVPLQVDTATPNIDYHTSAETSHHHSHLHQQHLHLQGGNDLAENYDDFAPSPVTSVSASSPQLHQQQPPTSSPSRVRASTLSHTNPGASNIRPRSSTLATYDVGTAATGFPSPGNAPTTTLSTTAPSGRRKRSRVTPEQLAYLERVFTIDKSPGAARRKEISELLGMQERQTQIWFQNRRAKAKMLQSRGRAAGARGSPMSDRSPMSPPELGVASDEVLHARLLAGEPITIIPCTDLTVGSWHRIAAKTGGQDLIAYIAEGSRLLTWFIQSEGFGFKMEIHWDTIKSVEISIKDAPPGQALARIILNQRPHFFMESRTTPDQFGASSRLWKQCTDWTEGMQASKMLKHEIIGSPAVLYNTLSRFEGPRSPLPVPLDVVHLEAAPSYHPIPPTDIPATRGDSTRHLPGSPSSAVSHGSGGYHSPAFPYSHHSQVPQHQPGSGNVRLSQSGDRSPADSGVFHDNSSDRIHSHPAYPPSASTFTNQYIPTSEESNIEYLQSPGQYLNTSYPSYPLSSGVASGPSRTPPTSTQHLSGGSQHHHSHSLTDFSSVPISNVITQRPYSSHSSLEQQFPDSTAQGSSLYNSSSILVSPYTHEMGTAPGMTYNTMGSASGSHLAGRTPPTNLSGEHSSSLGGALGPDHVPRSTPPTYPQH